MITPSKYIPFDKSIIFKMLSLVHEKEDGISIVELYRQHASSFDGVDEFMFSLDVLYVLNKIEVDFKEGTLRYVD